MLPWLSGFPVPALGSDAGEGQGGQSDGHVDDHNHQDRDGGGPAGGLLRVFRFLVHGQRDVPAPVNEDGQRHACCKGGEGFDGERIEPVRCDGCGIEGRPVRHVAERGDGEPAQDQQLEGHEHVLHRLGGFHAPVGNPARQGNEHQGCGDVQRQDLGEVRQLRIAEELGQHEVEEVHGDGGKVGQHDDGRRDQPPSAHPADPRPERPRSPRERGSGVGHGVVELPVAERHQQHRQEADQEDGRQVDAHLGDCRAEGGGEGVGRGDAGYADDDGADQPHRPGLEALLAQAVLPVRRAGCGSHVFGAHAVASREVSFDVEWVRVLSS